PDRDLIAAVERVAHGESPISPAIARYLLKRPAPTASGPGVDVDHQLSAPEHSVLKLVAQGYVTEEVGERLMMTAHAVATHIRSVYAKIQLRPRPAPVGLMN